MKNRFGKINARRVDEGREIVNGTTVDGLEIGGMISGKVRIDGVEVGIGPDGKPVEDA